MSAPPTFQTFVHGGARYLFRVPDVENCGPGAPAKTIEQLQAELDAANAQLRILESAQAAKSADEVIIGEKMRMGLTRSQAEAVVKRQRAFDESPHGKTTRARHEARQSYRAKV